MGVTANGLEELADDLQHAADASVDEVRKVVSKGALNIKKDAKAIVEGHSHLPHYPRAITYDTDVAGTLVSAEIGPDKAKRQGPLGVFVEYGSVKNAPIPHLSPALDTEEPRFIEALEALGGDLLEGRAVRSEGAPTSG